MMMINLYQTPPNISSIGVGCDSLGKTFLLLLVDNLGATGGLRLNSSQVNVKLIIFPLFLPEGNVILPITPKAVCGVEFKVTSETLSLYRVWPHRESHCSVLKVAY